MSTIPSQPDGVKSRAEYIAEAEAFLRLAAESASEGDHSLIMATPYYQRQAQVYATLAQYAPDPVAPPDYLSVCAERDEYKSAIEGVDEFLFTVRGTLQTIRERKHDPIEVEVWADRLTVLIDAWTGSTPATEFNDTPTEDSPC